MRRRYDRVTADVLAELERSGRVDPSLVDFREIVVEHALAVSRSGILSTTGRNPLPRRAVELAKRKGDKTSASKSGAPTEPPVDDVVPRSLRSLRVRWDEFRKKKTMTKRESVIAEKIRRSFLTNIQKAWREYADDFASGARADKGEAVAKMRARIDVSFSRAKMIVETETTHYYNKARREIYDASPDVTHYLFVAIRDHATTKWCQTRNGLVYAKGDQLLNDETPPVHWNCRSELLPLVKQNARHLRLIEDKNRARRRHKCEPLPAEWRARVG